MKRRMYWLMGLTLIVTLAAKEASAQTTDTELWGSVTGEVKLAKRFVGSLGQGLRLDKDVSEFKNTYTQLDFGYRLKKILGFTTGYRYIIKSTREEHRVFFDVLLRYKIKSAKIKLQFRTRMQHALRPTKTNDRTYLRNRIKVRRKFGRVEPYASLELSYRFDKSEFRRYRAIGGVKFKIIKPTSVAVFVAFSRQMNRATNDTDHIFGFSLNHRFN